MHITEGTRQRATLFVKRCLDRHNRASQKGFSLYLGAFLCFLRSPSAADLNCLVMLLQTSSCDGLISAVSSLHLSCRVRAVATPALLAHSCILAHSLSSATPTYKNAGSPPLLSRGPFLSASAACSLWLQSPWLWWCSLLPEELYHPPHTPRPRLHIQVADLLLFPLRVMSIRWRWTTRRHTCSRSRILVQICVLCKAEVHTADPSRLLWNNHSQEHG